VPESVMTLRVEDFVGTLKYIMRLRDGQGGVDDIDHLGNRGCGPSMNWPPTSCAKASSSSAARPGAHEPEGSHELTKIADLVNSKSISSSIDFFFGRGELSQVVDQQNPLSQLTHERRLVALDGRLEPQTRGLRGPRRAYQPLRPHLPIETPEGNNIGLISSLSIYAGVDEYGFLTTAYRKVAKGEITDEITQLRADEEMELVLAPPDALERKSRSEKMRLPKQHVLARDKGELRLVRGEDVNFIDISPKQTWVFPPR